MQAKLEPAWNSTPTVPVPPDRLMFKVGIRDPGNPGQVRVQGYQGKTEAGSMRRVGIILAGSLMGLTFLPSYEVAGEDRRNHHPHQFQWLSGTYLDPAIARPDLFPHWVWNSVPEHRRVYNRPRYGTGKFLYHFEPTSQESMAWETNVRNGNYRNHRGATVPMYCYPKPWEVLNTRARPNFTPSNASDFDKAGPGEENRVDDHRTLLELVEPASH